jgi:hypothetical protein
MNNGLNGRYVEQLKEWNHAREIAAELVRAFTENRLSDALGVLKKRMNIPSPDEVKRLLTDVLFLDGDDTVNTVARSVMEWE